MRVYVIEYREPHEGINSYNVFTRLEDLIKTLDKGNIDDEITIDCYELTENNGLEFFNKLYTIDKIRNYSAEICTEFNVQIFGNTTEDDDILFLYTIEGKLREFYEDRRKYYRTPQTYKINIIK